MGELWLKVIFILTHYKIIKFFIFIFHLSPLFVRHTPSHISKRKGKETSYLLVSPLATMGGTTTKYNDPVQPYKQFTAQAEADLKCNHLYNILDKGKEKTIATIDFKPAQYNVGGTTIDATCTLKVLIHLGKFCEDSFPQSRTVVFRWLNKVVPEHEWMLVGGSLSCSRNSTTDVILAHRTVSNLKEFQYCNSNEVLAVRKAKEDLVIMLQNNSIPSTSDLIVWGETHANAINNRGSTISLCGDDLTSEWLLSLINMTGIGTHSTERKTNRRTTSGQFTVGTNKKEMIGGKSTNVNKATNLPPTIFDEKSMNIIASLRNESYKRQDRLSKLMPDDVPAPAPETSGDRFLQVMKEKRDAHSQGTTAALSIAALPSTEPTTLTARCMLAQTTLAKRDSRFQINKKVEVKAKTKRQSAPSSLKNDSGDESEYDDDESTNKSKPSKSKSTNKKKDGKSNTRTKRQSAPSSLKNDSGDESEYDDDESTNKSKPTDTRKSWSSTANKKSCKPDAKQKSSNTASKSKQTKRKEVIELLVDTPDKSTSASRKKQSKQRKLKQTSVLAPIENYSYLDSDDVELPKKKKKKKKKKELPYKKSSAAKHEKKKKKKKAPKSKSNGYALDDFVIE